MTDFLPELAVFNALSPHMFEAEARLRSGKCRLVHYTSSANAVNTIQSERFWLRNVRCMNDYSEVQHGIDLLVRTFNENNGTRRQQFFAAFGQKGSALAQEAVRRFDVLLPSLPFMTFIGCLSEHDSLDPSGRLSMWRSYGQTDGGVAIFMNSAPFLAETDNLKAYSVPVSYLTDQDFIQRIDDTTHRIAKVVSSVEAVDSNQLIGIVFWWLVFQAVSLKHPAFREEQEWRVIYLPGLERSSFIEEATEIINGVPQIVQKIPLENDKEKGLIGADLNSVIDRVIIGPTQFPLIIRDALDFSLTAKGVDQAAKRIEISFIPLRT